MADIWLVGINAVLGLLQSDPARVIEVKLGGQRRDKPLVEIESIARANGVGVQRVEESFLQRVAEGAVHQSVGARIRALKDYDESDVAAIVAASGRPALLLILDQVTDPHNLGASMRTALAAGAQAVIIPKDRAAALTPAARKAAAGAAEMLPLVRVTNLARAMDVLKENGIWLYGAAVEGSASLFKTKLTSDVAFALGSEGEGLRRLTREKCDALIQIPMPGAIESLNVSVAAGICLFEACRQRGL